MMNKSQQSPLKQDNSEPPFSLEPHQKTCTHNVEYWGSGYFNINAKGNITVCPNPDFPNIVVDLAELAHEMQSKGTRLPSLFCFPQILQHRLRSINQAFKRARESFGYKGDYFLVYPIKVNQHKRVIETLVNADEPLGLEAGSKAELMAVLSHAMFTRTVIVCNGYKDREYICLALTGEKLGHKVYLVIEKMSEIELVLEEAKRLGVTPRLGVRARLASQGAGRWQASGGEKSKFGLSATQVLKLVERLRETDQIASLQLLHFHLGSQLGDIRDIATGVRESAQFYVELHKQGVDISCFDVGGGLGVDYDGTRTHSDFSVNYGLNEYANNVIFGIKDACDKNGLKHPTVITESGRAVTAHHTVLVANIVGIERYEFSTPAIPEKTASGGLQGLWETWLEIEQNVDRSVREWVHDSQLNMNDIHTHYSLGLIGLKECAQAEQTYLAICYRLLKQMNPDNRTHRAIIDVLQERMADKFYVNFSLFQSLPDAWGIDQIFPVSPLSGLNQEVSSRAVILDMTCDSDGAVKRYIDKEDVTTTMPMQPYDAKKPPLIGFFMVGAYQEILGNMHNLFGDTASVEVQMFNDGRIDVSQTELGNTVAQMLEYVQLNPQELMARYETEIKSTHLSPELQTQFLAEFEAGLNGYTYLEEDDHDK